VENGLGFFLQHIRDASTNHQQRVEISNIENITMATEVIVEPTTSQSRTKVEYDLLSTTLGRIDVRPIQVVRECYESETAPKFGFSKRVRENNYVRSCKWSPDGEWLVTDSEDRIARIFRLNDEGPQLDLWSKVATGDLIYDHEWHPTQSMFAITTKDQPIHLWSTDSHLQISFRGINHYDELSSAMSLCFSLDGQSLYAGYYKMIRVFDLERPGKQVKDISTFEKRSLGGQKAIISCISMCPTMAGVYAVGCVGGSVGLYSDLTGSCDCLFGTSSMGVTHLQYSSDGNQLYIGERKSSCIECFDLRFPGHVFATYSRPNNTQQKIYFQVDAFDRYLFSGSTSGEMTIHDLRKSRTNSTPQQPDWNLPTSRAALAGLSLHPNLPLVAITTGQRVFPRPMDDSSSEEDDSYVSVKEALDNSLQLFNLLAQ